MNNVLIFCHSYLDVTAVLKLLMMNFSAGRRSTLIVVKDELYNLFKKILPPDMLVNLTQLKRFKRPQYPLNMVSQAWYLRRLFKLTIFGRYSHAYFFSRYYAELEYYLLNKLRKEGKCSIEFCCNPNLDISFDRSDIMCALLSPIYRFAYGSDLEVRKRGHDYVTEICGSFFDNVKMKNSSEIEALNFDLSPFSVNYDYKLVYFYSNLDDYEYIDKSSVVSVVNDIYQFVNKFEKDPNRLAYKFHPMQKERSLKPIPGQEILDYIPSQLVKLTDCNMIISVFSAAVFSQAYEEIPKILLVNVVRWHSEEMHQRMVAYLTKNCTSNTYFPNSVAEIINLLTSKYFEAGSVNG